jgi:anti-anti-sigma factor
VNDHFGTELIDRDGEAVLVVRGEIDLATAPMLDEACDRLASVTDQLVLDLAGVTFMDASGLGTLVRALHRDQTKRILVRDASDGVLRLLHITGLAEAFLEPSVTRHVDESGACGDSWRVS